MSYVIEIPNWHPARLNLLMGVHWAIAGRRKTSDMQMMAAYACKKLIPKAPGKRLVEIIIQVTKGRAPDPDAYHKSVLDGLVRTGYLLDDSEKWCEAPPAKIVRGKSKSTTIRLTDIIQGPNTYADGAPIGKYSARTRGKK